MFWLIAAATVILDQLTKFIVAGNMVLDSSVVLIPGVLDLTFIRNDGAAWGMLSGKQTMLICVTSVVIVLIAVYAVKKRSELSRLELIALGLIAGGGLVGRITTVGPNWARVTSIISDNSNVSCMTITTQDNLIVSGDLSLMAEGVISFSMEALWFSVSTRLARYSLMSTDT